jgi:uncharacterized protein
MTELRVRIRHRTRNWSGILTLPRGKVLGGMVPLHPANDPSKDLFLFRDLARVAARRGIATLRYDRRAHRRGDEVPFEDQADDAIAATRVLAEHVGNPRLRVGLWAWSQGAWAAALAAARSRRIRGLVLVASNGVSPAEQMRYGTAEHLRRAGYDRDALRELHRLRVAYEQFLRGEVDRDHAQRVVDRSASRPWFPLSWLPRRLPIRARWADMDFDPRPIFARVRVPTLLFYGETDEWSPIEASIRSWREAARRSGNRCVQIVRLPGTTHTPTLGGRRSVRSISPDYRRELDGWLTAWATEARTGSAR